MADVKTDTPENQSALYAPDKRLVRMQTQLQAEGTIKNGKKDGLERTWHEDGDLVSAHCFSNDEIVPMSNCE